jgi:hypothetical protein
MFENAFKSYCLNNCLKSSLDKKNTYKNTTTLVQITYKFSVTE